MGRPSAGARGGRRRRRACIGWTSGLAAAAVVLAACATGAMSGLVLSVRNDDPARTMRCVLLYAHWVSEETAPVPPGGATEVALETSAATGEVMRRNSLGRAMALEAIHCRFGEAGNRARAPVVIDDLRGKRGRIVVHCQDRGGAPCREAAAE